MKLINATIWLPTAIVESFAFESNIWRSSQVKHAKVCCLTTLSVSRLYSVMIGWLMNVCSSCWNENWERKQKYTETPAPVTLFSLEIPYYLTWDRTWPAAVGSRRCAIRIMTITVDIIVT
jgi:hypothetical protein